MQANIVAAYLHHGLDCNIRNILRESLAFGRDGAIGFCQGSEADSANLVTLLAYDPYRRAEVFRALAAPELVQERLRESWHLVSRLLGVYRHYRHYFLRVSHLV